MTDFISPDPSKILILDISKWQDDINTSVLPDFNRMKSLGVSGVIIKCGEGSGIDRAFHLYVNALELSGIPFGTYWYYNNLYSPSIQAKLFLETIKGHDFKLGIWADLEDRKDAPYKGWRHWYDFIAALQSEYSGKIGIYTGYYYFIENTLPTVISSESLNWFSKFPLWIATYSTKPMVPRPWNSQTIWQFTDFLDGNYYGVESKELDGNYFNGTLDEFNNFFGTSVSEEPPQENNVTQYQMTTISSGTRIRSDHTTYAQVLTSVPSNVVMSGSELWTASSDGNEVKAGDKWLKVSYNGASGWMAYIHKGVPICSNLLEVGAEPPQPDEVTLAHVIEVYSDGSIKIDGNPY